jgi:CheY-like chemotaxis protein
MTPSESTDRRETPPSSCRILTVEDDPDVAESFALLLKMCGNEVCTVSNGIAAIEAARKFHPTIAFIDIDLPGMNGYELAREFRREYGSSLRMFALTGFGQQRDIARSMDAGFDMHLVKPIDIGSLQRLLHAPDDTLPRSGGGAA